MLIFVVWLLFRFRTLFPISFFSCFRIFCLLRVPFQFLLVWTIHSEQNNCYWSQSTLDRCQICRRRSPFCLKHLYALSALQVCVLNSKSSVCETYQSYGPFSYASWGCFRDLSYSVQRYWSALLCMLGKWFSKKKLPRSCDRKDNCYCFSLHILDIRVILLRWRQFTWHTYYWIIFLHKNSTNCFFRDVSSNRGLSLQAVKLCKWVTTMIYIVNWKAFYCSARHEKHLFRMSFWGSNLVAKSEHFLP